MHLRRVFIAAALALEYFHQLTLAAAHVEHASTLTNVGGDYREIGAKRHWTFNCPVRASGERRSI